MSWNLSLLRISGRRASGQTHFEAHSRSRSQAKEDMAVVAAHVGKCLRDRTPATVATKKSGAAAIERSQEFAAGDAFSDLSSPILAWREHLHPCGDCLLAQPLLLDAVLRVTLVSDERHSG